MMRTMRENTKIIMLVTALAFAALMVFEWGMDASGRSSGGVGGSIGEVNGEGVSYDAYMNAYRSIYDQVQANTDGPITSQRNSEIEDMAWDRVVDQILIRQELEQRGVEVTEEEIRQAAQYSPPPEFREAEMFQTEGQFDIQKYHDYLSSPAVDRQLLVQLEQYYRDVIPRAKLIRQITSGVYYPDGDLWHEYRLENEKVAARYIPMNPSQLVPDSEVTVSEDEIRAYYEANREEFAVPARATVTVAAISKAPTPADSAAALERARSLREEIRGGADFAEVARRESADSASAQRGGSLGTFGRNQLVAPVEEAAFEAPVGRVTEPVASQFGYHLVRVESREGDEVTASHILIPIERTEDSEIELLTMADSLEALAEDKPLEAAAAELGLETRTAEINTDLPVVQGVGRVAEGADWVFEDRPPTGEVSPVFENDQSFYALELESRTPAGYRSLEDATPEIRQTLTFEKKLERAAEVGRQVAEAIRSGATMEDVAVERDLEIRTAGPFSRTEFVPGLGRMNEAIGTAFGMEVGETSGAVRTERNVFVLQVTERIPADSTQWARQKERQRARLMARAENERFQTWLQAMRNQSTIVDRRDEVLQPAGQQEQTGPYGQQTGL